MSELWIHPLAEAELQAAARFYEERLAGLGKAFLGQVEVPILATHCNSFLESNHDKGLIQCLGKGTKISLICRHNFRIAWGKNAEHSISKIPALVLSDF